MFGPVFHMIPGTQAQGGPYSHVVEQNGWLFVTGQFATDTDDDSCPLPDGIAAQRAKVFDDLQRVLAGVGAGLPDVVSVRVFLTRFEQD